MMLCVKTVTYNFSLNGSLIGPVVPKKGLRQGDPLSPYSFLLCVEGLSNAIDDASTNELIHGCQINSATPTISHLLFADDSFLFFRATSQEARNIKKLLVDYEKLSGQSVNFRKSGVYFSLNVAEDKRREISQILEVHNEITNTMYLGLPSLVGRSKKRVFNYLKEKATKKIQEWRAKPISQGGKTVLIRNVAHVISTYSMSCFLLPKTLCHEMEQLYNNYWWRTGRGEDQKGINWLSWNNMSYAKSKGGLGFQNLHGYNIALLGKHIWNFMQNPQSLVTRVFKGRYFPHDHVLKATKGQGSSFIWQGIWTAKEELKNGFRWVLGNVNDIVATQDPWLRNKANFKVEQNQLYVGRTKNVSSLILPGEKRWNIELIQRNFLKEDADEIVKVPVPQRMMTDRVVWANSTNCLYTAKHAYHFWYDSHFGSTTVPHCTGWKNIWHLKLPPKVKVFVWRFFRNAVPVRRRLSSKGVRVPITCPMCTTDIEHMVHLFYDCSFAVGCWNHIGLMYDWSQTEFAPEWLIQKLSTATNEEKVKICVVLWGIWRWRNKKVWEGKVVTQSFAMDSSFRMLSEWTQARKKHESSTEANVGVTPASRTTISRWKLPAAGVFKVNVDASVYPGTNTFDVGMVLRDSTGTFMEAKNYRF